MLADCYTPGNQWRRLFTNRMVGAGWRYTSGIYLCSDNISVALHEAVRRRIFHNAS